MYPCLLSGSFSAWEDILVVTSVFVAFRPRGLLKCSRLTVQRNVLLESSSVATFPGIIICESAFRSITGTLGLLAVLLVKAIGLVTSVDCRFFGLLGSRGRRIFNTSPKDQQWSSTNSMSHFFIVSMNGVSILNGKVLHPYLAV